MFAQEITMEVGLHWKVEKNIKILDIKLTKSKVNKNSSKGGKFRMEGKKHWSTTRIRFGINKEYDIGK